MSAGLHHTWAAEALEERLGLFHALEAAGFTPRDPRYTRHEERGRSLWHRSHRRARLGRKALYSGYSEPGDLYMDHREDWKHPDHPDLWTAMSTWHVHGCLHGYTTNHSGVTIPDHNTGPSGYPEAWCGPSWYFPRAITGVVWHPDVEHLVLPAIEAFRVDR